MELAAEEAVEVVLEVLVSYTYRIHPVQALHNSHYDIWYMRVRLPVHMAVLVEVEEVEVPDFYTCHSHPG